MVLACACITVTGIFSALTAICAAPNVCSHPGERSSAGAGAGTNRAETSATKSMSGWTGALSDERCPPDAAAAGAGG
eukprot:3100007-Prymnesium_polylepis.1